MNAVVEKEEKMGSKAVNPKDPSSYGCEILLEKTTFDKVNDKTFPTDARIITYIFEGETFIDLTRCRKVVDLFDMYYDRYGKGSIQSIDFGYGNINPKMWGYKAPETKTKRK